MEYNQPPQFPISNSKFTYTADFNNDLAQFIAKLKYFLTINAPLYPHIIKYIAGGCGFAIYAADNDKQVNSLFEEIFQVSFQKFLRDAKRFGFSVKIKNSAKGVATLLLFKQKLFDESQLNASLELQLASKEQSQEEIQDQFPKDEEVQAIMKKKEDSKLNFVKANIILNKVMSEGNAGLGEWRKNDDASIEIKLEEQGQLHHFFSSQKKESKEPSSQNGQPNGLDLADRSQNQKESYEKCAKIIDTTIIEFLQAHRNNKLPLKKEQLMNNIAEIYDILSNSIQNIAGVVQLFGGKQANAKKQQLSQGSLPDAFKSITES